MDHNRTDSIGWKSDQQGLFSVKSCYHMLDSSSDGVLCPWEKVWRSKAPLKVACFSWIVAWEACLTQSNLQKRRFQLCSRCPLCEEHPEEVGHLFLHCRVTRQLWNMFLAMLGMSWAMPKSIVELLQGWSREGISKKSLRTWNTIPQAMWWTIWLERNNRIFEGTSSNIHILKQRCIFLLAFWCNLVIEHEVDGMLDTIEGLPNL